LIGFITDKIVQSIDPSASSDNRSNTSRSLFDAGSNSNVISDSGAGAGVGVLGSISDNYRRYFKVLSDLLLHGAVSVESAFHYCLPTLLSTAVRFISSNKLFP
jgi:hypothetical protein